MGPLNNLRVLCKACRTSNMTCGNNVTHRSYPTMALLQSKSVQAVCTEFPGPGQTLMRDGLVFTSVIIYVVLKGWVCFNVVFSCDFSLLYQTYIFKNLYISYVFVLSLFYMQAYNSLQIFLFSFYFLFSFVRTHLFVYRAYLKTVMSYSFFICVYFSAVYKFNVFFHLSNLRH